MGSLLPTHLLLTAAARGELHSFNQGNGYLPRLYTPETHSCSRGLFSVKSVVWAGLGFGLLDEFYTNNDVLKKKNLDFQSKFTFKNQ